MAIKSFNSDIVASVRVRAWAFFPEYLQGAANLTGSSTVSCLGGRKVGIVGSLSSEASQVIPTLSRIQTGINSGNIINLQPQTSLGIRLPTGVTIDFSQLNLPLIDGVRYTFKLEEDFVRETEGNESSLPALDLMSYQAPYQGASYPSAAFSLYNVYGRRRPGSAYLGAFNNMTVRIKYLIAKFAIFMPWEVYINPIPVKTARGIAALTSIASIIANNVKVHGSAISTQAVVASMTLPENWLVKLAQSAISSEFTKTIDAFKYKGIVNEVLSNPVSLLTAPVKTARITKTLSAVSSQSSTVVKTVKPTVTMAAQSSLTCDAQGPMTLVYNTNLIAGNTITLPLRDTVNVTVDWGDGTTSSSTTSGDISKTYSSKGTYTVKIYGTVSRFGRDDTNSSTGAVALTKVLSLGQIGLTSLQWAFNGCSNLIVVPDTLPPTITSLRQTFRNCSSFNGLIPNNQTFNSWNTSNVTNMEGIFLNCSSFNTSINSWNTSNVTTMVSMFQGASSFNQPLSSWNTSKVTTMAQMFYNASSFNQPLTRSGNIWNTSLVTVMTGMFQNASSFNQNLSGWCVSYFNSSGPVSRLPPTNFDTGATSWTLSRPVWGTCP